VARVDDEDAIYYNPAGLAGVDGFSAHLLNLQIEAGGAVVDSALAALFGTGVAVPNLSDLSSLNSFMGRSFNFRGNDTLTLAGKYWGVSIFTDFQGGAVLQNPAFPVATVLGQGTYGIQAATGFPVFKAKKTKTELRLGAAFKYMWRLGGYRDYSLTQMAGLSSASLISTLLGSQRGSGWGIDLGAQFKHQFNRSGFSIMAGTVLTNVPNISFGNVTTGAPSPILMDWTSGFAVGWATRKVSMSLEFDLKHSLDAVDFRKKTHVGYELKLPIVTLGVGFSEGYFTYGAQVDVWLLKFNFVSYTVEQGGASTQNPDTRYMFRIDFGFGL
jgi:hypothetical protein